jgi:hypothetical protein
MVDNNTLCAALEAAGFPEKEVKSAISTESTVKKAEKKFRGQELNKNLYLVLWSSGIAPGAKGAFTQGIKDMTKSPYSHASWSPYSDGRFWSLNASEKSLTTALIEENGALQLENLNNFTNIGGDRNYGTKYYVYSVAVTENEYARATETVKRQEHADYRYSFQQILKIGIKIVFNTDPDSFFKGYKDSGYKANWLVCSTYCMTTLCMISPRIMGFFRSCNIDLLSVSPKNITQMPFVNFLFEGNLVFEFDRWKKLYESKFGLLPN